MTKADDSNLQWLVQRASSDAFFLGSALAEYQAAHGIAARKLAKILQCTPKGVARLALCRWPRDHEARFREDLEHIAKFAGCDAERLVQVLREVDAIASLRGEGNEGSQGLLMAARDRRSHEIPKGKRTPGKGRSRK
jgi:hypothetical protein